MEILASQSSTAALKTPVYSDFDRSSITQSYHLTLYPSSQLRPNIFGENPVHIAISQIFCPSTNKAKAFLVREMLITKLKYLKKNEIGGNK
jgi:hypothetical protein